MIKFRVWLHDMDDIKDGQWLTMKEAFMGGFIEWEGNELHWFKDPSIKVVQYTGLKDKNDTEIYEGDIVTGHLFYTLTKGVPVQFKEGMFGIVDFYSSTGGLLKLSCLKDVEVVGNIYEQKRA